MTDSFNATNPMIDAEGDIYRVSSALEFLSKAFRELRGEPLCNSEAFGAAVILETCAAALRTMQEQAES